MGTVKAHFRVSLGLLALLGASSCPAPRPACDSSTCQGCCDAQGVCQPGTWTDACGFGGFSCSQCSGQCAAGLCTGSSGGGSAGGGSAGGGAAGGGSAGGGAAGG